MKTKVCGMKDPQNIRELIDCQLDFIGFIFYEKSPRYAGELDAGILNLIPKNIKKIGVFVDEKADKMKNIADQYQLTGIQLHGKETPDICRQMRECGLLCIKAFSIAEAKDFEATKAYEEVADYFLFDTKTPAYGGSGLKFDWSILSHYQGKIPFLLSGGISIDDVENIKKIVHSQFIGIDINSKFEVEAGVKNVELIKTFIEKVSA
jgi:phosphoribosylanthranilate isomerase